MNRLLSFVLAACALMWWAPPSSAQSDYALFSGKARNASLLYRGHRAFEYNIAYNGTYWWSGPEFMPGSVIFNSKPYDGVWLNIDAARQELVVRTGYGVSLKVLEKPLVRECTFGGRRFLNLQYIYGPGAPSGWWEVLYEGRCMILQRVNKSLEQDLEASKREQTRYDGLFRNNVYQAFIWSADYCHVSPDGTISMVRRRRDLLKLFDKPVRREIRSHFRVFDESGSLPLDRYCVEAARFIETR